MAESKMNIIELAKEAGLLEVKTRPEAEVQLSKDALEKFAALVTAQLMSESASICAEREWVDLTDDEIEYAFWSNENCFGGIRAVIAAFKEKQK